MIALDDGEMAERLRRLRQHAMDASALARHQAKGVVIEHYPERGWNARMTDVQAAIGLCQLDVLETILRERSRLAGRYTEALAGLEGVEVPRDPPYAQRTWQSYPIRVAAGAPLGALELMTALQRDGIATRRGVMAIHLEASYAGQGDAGLHQTEAAARDTVLLPLFPGLSGEAQDHVVERVAAHLAAVPA